MTYQFENPIACTEALVTAIEKLNDFEQYTQHFSSSLQKTAKKSTWNFERGYFYEADFCTYL